MRGLLNRIAILGFLLCLISILGFFSYEKYLEMNSISIPCSHQEFMYIVKGSQKVFCINNIEHTHFQLLECIAILLSVIFIPLNAIIALTRKQAKSTGRV
jgi:hypothetical protein